MLIIIQQDPDSGQRRRCDLACHYAERKKCDCLCEGKYHKKGKEAQLLIPEWDREGKVVEI